MVFQFESLGEEFVQTTRTSMDVKEPIACLAVEVVVVLGSENCNHLTICMT